MSVALIFSALMIAQAGPAVMYGEPQSETRDVAFEEISAGETRAAIAALEEARAENPGDPALLINLGAAYVQAGDIVRAEECYREAVRSDERYRLELADGQWVDSRQAARMALAQLEQSRFAAR